MGPYRRLNVPIANAVLCGWNLGILTLFASAIALSALAHSVDLTGTTATMFIFVMVVFLGLGGGILAGRKSAAWFAKRSPKANLIWLVGLMLVTFLLLPAPFQYIIVDV